ncbi:MAG: DUF327 family protein [bacterium]
MKLNRALDKKLKKQVDRWKNSAKKAGDSSLLESEEEKETEKFQETIEGRKLELLDMEVQDLVDEIKSTGQTLVEHPTPTHARHYQRAIASFLKKSQQLSKQVERILAQRKFGVSEALSSGRGEEDPNTKEHVIVKTIDEKMDKITKAVMENESDKIDLSQNVEEIRGLVVDLVSSIRGPGE